MNTRYLKFTLLLPFLFSCLEKEQLPISESLGKPGVVTNVVVEPTAGGAVVSYKIPNTEDLLAVKCLYTTTNGKEYEVTASYYEDKLAIQGYNDTSEHTATIYAVNRAQELSDPIEVKFTPLESALAKAIKSVAIEQDFGGARFSWRNPEKAPLNIEFLAPDSTGEMSTMNIMMSDIDENVYNIRGYAPEPKNFSMIINDNFDNYSDTLTAEVIPLFEEKLNKKNMRVMNLANDKSLTNWEGKDAYILDDDHNTFGCFITNALPGAPATFDLGTVAKLSRLVVHQRIYNFGANIAYGHGNPKTFEVYVCDHEPSQSGDWSEWTKVMDCEIVKPSGSPGSTVTDLDMDVANNGHEFSFDVSLTSVRYVRIVFMSAFGGATFSNIADVDFYGQIEK